MDKEFTSYISRMLPSGGKLSITTPERVIKPEKTTSLIVKVFYEAEANGLKKHFIQKVHFVVRNADIKIQTINPEAWEENVGESDLNEQDLSEILVQFSQPIGTIGLVLPVIRKNGNPNMVSFGNEFRSFSFDTITGIVSFRTKTQLGRLISLDLPLLKNKSGNHAVLICWDYSKGGILGLDGIEKQDMEENTE